MRSTFNDIHKPFARNEPNYRFIVFRFPRTYAIGTFVVQTERYRPGKIVNPKIEKPDNALKIKKTVIVFYLLTSVSSEN